MSILSRVWPYLWARRRRLVAVTVLSWAIAVLWGANLSTSFPAIKVLLEGEGLEPYLDEQIAVAESEIDHQAERLEDLEAQPDEPVTESTRYIRKRAREQSKLSDSSYKLLILKWVKRNIVRHLPEDSFDLLAVICAVFLLGTLTKGVLVVIQETLSWGVVHGVINEIREDTFRHLITLDYGTLTTCGRHDLLSRLTHDLQEFGQGLSVLIARIFREPLKIGSCVTIALIVNWRLTLLSFVMMPVIGLLFHQVGRRFKRATRRKMEFMAEMHHTLEESFDGLKVVVAESAEERRAMRFSRENRSYFRKALRIAKLNALMKPMTELLAFAAVLLALVPGAWIVMHNGTHFLGLRLADSPMDLARLSVLYAVLAGCLDPLRKLSDLFSTLKRSSAAGERVFSLLALKTTQPKPKTPKTLPVSTREWTFSEVGFSYPSDPDAPSRPQVLHDVNLTLTRGETVLVVGPNGCGKSTLLSLLTRLYDPTEGKVQIDGLNLKDLDLSAYRKRIGYVPQETHLFTGTLAENIAYGLPKLSRAEIEKAAERAGVTSFLDHFPHGLDTEAGRAGGRLSGGQRQRIALARALVRNPELLILDEATSAIDANNAREFERSLHTIREDRTLVIVTHAISPELLELQPRILVLDEGRIVGDGTHEELLAECRVFRRLFDPISLRAA